MQARIAALDGLRGIAVLLVVACHFVGFLTLSPTGPWTLLLNLLATGWMGVEIFFVLSGFLITGILLNDRVDARRFYRNRAFRILPVFLIVFLVVLSFIPTPRTWVILSYLLFLGNFTALRMAEIAPLVSCWSLAVEEQFYLIWPQIAWRMKRPAVLKTALSVAAMSSLLRIAAALWGFDAYKLFKITPTRLDGLALGCAIAAAAGIPAAQQWLAQRWEFIAKLAAISLVLGFVALKLNYFAMDRRAQIIAIPTISVLSAMIIFAASQNLLPAKLKSFLCNPALIYFGKRSYALYLIHLPIMCAISSALSTSLMRLDRDQRPIASFGLMIAALAASIALAEISWHMVERPAQRLKKRLEAGQTTRPAYETVAD